MRTKARTDFEKDFFKLVNNSVFGKTIENKRKHQDMKSVTTDRGRSNLVSQPKYHTKEWFMKFTDNRDKYHRSKNKQGTVIGSVNFEY